MSVIAYICLSDLHFGAENSILTGVSGDVPHADPAAPVPALDSLLECLRALVATNGRAAPKPSLILAGDILDMALSSDGLALTAFERFVRGAFVGDERLFAPIIYFIPGNHDHHLWESTRELQYADFIASLGPGEPIPDPWHSTRLLPPRAPTPDAIDATLLTTALRRHSGLAGVSVQTAYPNLGLVSADGARCLLIHHGHFVEGAYRLMSEMRDVIFPEHGPSAGEQVWDIEADNFAWIDFFWSTLGRSGQVGTDVVRIYEMLQRPDLLRQRSRIIARELVKRWRRRGVTGAIGRPAARVALQLVMGAAVSRFHAPERFHQGGAGVPMTANAAAGLDWYLPGPLRKQLERELGAAPPPERLTFVFGHTHKPFEQHRTMILAGVPRPVDVLNTGGWVVDTANDQPLQGAAAIIIDEELRAVSLRMYNQGGGAVNVHHPDPLAVGDFLEQIRSAVNNNADPWQGFSKVAAKVVTERHAAIAKILSS